MPVAPGPESPTDRTAPVAVSESYARDALIAWYRGEFAAANALIDSLCGHLVEVSGGTIGTGSEYDAVLAAIHRRRLNWIPVLQMQKYHPIAEVSLELKKLTVRKMEEARGCLEGENNVNFPEKVMENEGNRREEEADDDSPESEITDSGSQEPNCTAENIRICINHDECNMRSTLISKARRFSAKEHVKGRMVNVVKGLKLYEDVFSEQEISKVYTFVNELQAAGRNGELAGETFILFNKQIKGNRRELVQFGVPIFGQRTDETTVNIKPIPALLQSVIDHLVQWRLIPEYKKPNGCVINFFEQEEYSQPFLKPPHLEQPITTLILSESTLEFGRTLTRDNDGSFTGLLTLPLKEGHILVMRGNSADMARHVMSPSPNKRVIITFFRVRLDPNQNQTPPLSPQAGIMTLSQLAALGPFPISNALPNRYHTNLIPNWEHLQTPVVMLSPNPMMLSTKRLDKGGTGVFLPWNVRPRKPAKHLPPRVQKLRLLALPSPAEESKA